MSSVARRSGSNGRLPAWHRPIPLLHNGDRLSRQEFERRYEAMPDVRKIQLVEGIVYMASPVRYLQHDLPQTILVGLLTMYAAQTPGVSPGASPTIRLDDRNVFEPDGVLFLSQGGNARIDANHYISGPPEFVAEVGASTVDIDSTAKYDVYRRRGVREYLLWRAEENMIQLFALKSKKYLPIKADSSGVLQSRVFPGLWFDVPAMLEARLPDVMATLQAGIASPEHAAFVAKLAK
jgi:Uma2 family endonuclease